MIAINFLPSDLIRLWLKQRLEFDSRKQQEKGMGESGQKPEEEEERVQSLTRIEDVDSRRDQ